MQTSLCKLFVFSLIAVVLTSFVMVPAADAQRRGGGGGGGAAARGAGGAQASGGRADARTNEVRSTSVNNTTNISSERNVNVNVDCSGRCGGWDHPVAAATVVGTTMAVTAAAIGSMVATVPASCVPVNYGGVVYQQCGSTWYAPQGAQYMVVNPPY